MIGRPCRIKYQPEGSVCGLTVFDSKTSTASTDNVENKDAALRWDQDVFGLGWNAFEVDDIEAARAYMISRGVVPTEIQTRNDGQKAF